MFGSKKARIEPTTSSKVETIIGEGTHISGTITLKGVVRVDGVLEGTVNHTGELIVGPKGKIQATVKSTRMAVAGEVHGDLAIEGKLELLPGAKVYGDIASGKLVIHEGAAFHGRSSMALAEAAASKQVDTANAPSKDAPGTPVSKGKEEPPHSKGKGKH